jgi:hypothetical protein
MVNVVVLLHKKLVLETVFFLRNETNKKVCVLYMTKNLVAAIPSNPFIQFIKGCVETFARSNKADRARIYKLVDDAWLKPELDRAALKAALDAIEDGKNSTSDIVALWKGVYYIDMYNKPLSSVDRTKALNQLQKFGLNVESVKKYEAEYFRQKIHTFLKTVSPKTVFSQGEYLLKIVHDPKDIAAIDAHMKMVLQNVAGKNSLNSKYWALYNNNTSNKNVLRNIGYSHAALLNKSDQSAWMDFEEYETSLKKIGAKVQTPVYLAILRGIQRQIDNNEWYEDAIQMGLVVVRVLKNPDIVASVMKLAVNILMFLYHKNELRANQMNALPNKILQIARPMINRAKRHLSITMSRNTNYIFQKSKIRVLCTEVNKKRKSTRNAESPACTTKDSYLFRGFEKMPTGDSLIENDIMYTYMNDRGYRHVVGYGHKYKWLVKYEIIKPLPLIDLNNGDLCRPAYRTYLENHKISSVSAYAGSDPHPSKDYQLHLFHKRGIMGHIATARLDCHRKHSSLMNGGQKSMWARRKLSKKYAPNESRGPGTITRGLESNVRTRLAVETGKYENEVHGSAEAVIYLPEKRREYLRPIKIAKINARGGLDDWQDWKG